MSYFKHMPVTYYKGDFDAQIVKARDIIVRARILEYVKNSSETVLDYTIRDGERPEHLAHRVYGKPEYHWVILLYNEIHDPFFEWPMSSRDLDNMVEKKYVGRSYHIDLNDAFTRQPYFYIETGNAKVAVTIGGVTTELDATITEWDPNMYRVVVSADSPGSTSNIVNARLIQTRSDGKVVDAIIKRVVDDHRYSAKYFINQNTGIIVDHHIINADPTIKRDLGQNIMGTVASLSGLSLIERYVEANTEVIFHNGMMNTIVTNYDDEIQKNDAKRVIKMVRPEFVDLIVKDIQKVFISG